MTDRLAVGITEAARLLGVSRTKLYAALKEKQLPVIRLGRRVLIATEDLRAFLNRAK